VIYAGRHDKVITPHRDVATWWNGEEFYDPKKVAVSMSRVVAAGRPVYLYEEPEIDRRVLEKELAAVGLVTRSVEAWNLLSIQRLDSPAPD
jgi:hypothetical protein